jgi:hypothetical protein
MFKTPPALVRLKLHRHGMIKDEKFSKLGFIRPHPYGKLIVLRSVRLNFALTPEIEKTLMP